jgi:hypothetical protein
VGSKHHLATGLLLAALLDRSAFADGPSHPALRQAATPESSPAPKPTPKPSPGPKARSRARRSIRLSIDEAVTEVLNAHDQPCEHADRAGVPCFPVTIETEGPRFSVAESLHRYRPLGGKPAPGGPPTNSEMQEQLTGRRWPLPGFSFDPGCAMKSLMRSLRTGHNTFYLYRLQDAGGTRPLLLDHELSRETLRTRPEIRELIGEYSGECEAIAAWHKALREQLAAEQAAERANTVPPGPTPAPPAPKPTPAALNGDPR